MLSNKLSVVLSVCVFCILAGTAYAQGPMTAYHDNSVVSVTNSTDNTAKELNKLLAVYIDAEAKLTILLESPDSSSAAIEKQRYSTVQALAAVYDAITAKSLTDESATVLIKKYVEAQDSLTKFITANPKNRDFEARRRTLLAAMTQAKKEFDKLPNDPSSWSEKEKQVGEEYVSKLTAWNDFVANNADLNNAIVLLLTAKKDADNNYKSSYKNEDATAINKTDKTLAQLIAELKIKKAEAVNETDGTKLAEQLLQIQQLEDAIKAKTGANYNAITFLGTGGSGTSSGSSGIMLGFHHEEPDNKTVNLYLNLNGNKTISGPDKDRIYGSNILNPGTEGFGGFLELSTKLDIPKFKHENAMTKSLKNQKLSYYGRFGFSELKWQKDTKVAGIFTTNPISGYILYASVGIQSILSSQMSEENPSQMVSQIGTIWALTWRRIGGDLIGETDKRTEFLGTSQTNFWGAELTLFARSKSAQPYIRLSWIDGGIKGVSNFQAYAGIDVFGDAAVSR